MINVEISVLAQKEICYLKLSQEEARNPKFLLDRLKSKGEFLRVKDVNGKVWEINPQYITCMKCKEE